MHNALKNGIKLYYRILKLHRRVLPSKLRSIGDIYVRQEFKHHHETPQIQFYSQFLNKWELYYSDLSKQGLKSAAKDISAREE